MATTNSNSRKRKIFFQKLVVNLLLLVCFAFLLFPVFWVTSMAFKSHDDILTWPPKFVFKPTLENFQNITTAVRTYRVGAVSSDFLKGFGNSLLVTTSALALSLLTGIPAAYALGRFRFKGRNDIAFTFLSFRFAPELLVIIPIYLIFQKIGLYDTFFGLTKGGPGSTLMNFQVSAYTTAFTYTKISDGSALMMLNWLIVYVISMFLVKFWRKSQDRLS